MNTHLPGTVLLLAGAMTVLAGAAAAQESLHTQFAQCRDISSDAQRLQCFDAIKTDQPPTTVETPEPAAAERALEAERQQLAAERAALAAQRRQLETGNGEPTQAMLIAAFGAEMLDPETRPPIPGKKLESFSAAAVQVQAHLRDKIIVKLDNGQVWRQSDSRRSLQLSTDNGPHPITLERGWLNSYWMIDQQTDQRMAVLRVR